MKPYLTVLLISVLCLLSACGPGTSTEYEEDSPPETPVEFNHRITQMTAEQFDKVRQVGDAITIVDVRRPDEIANGKVPGAIEIDFESDDFERRIAGLDREGTYIMYCHSGNRSNQAAEYMHTQGFRFVYNLEGGYRDWSKRQSQNN